MARTRNISKSQQNNESSEILSISKTSKMKKRKTEKNIIQRGIANLAKILVNGNSSRQSMNSSTSEIMKSGSMFLGDNKEPSFFTSTPKKQNIPQRVDSKPSSSSDAFITIDEASHTNYQSLEISNSWNSTMMTSATYTRKKLLHTLLLKLLEDGVIETLKRKMEVKVESEEDSYIKSVVKNKKPNILGNNLFNPMMKKTFSGRRLIVIDGSNVAMGHGRGKYYSIEGLKISIDYFVQRGHKVKAFVPQYRCKQGKSSNPSMLKYLESKGLVVFTPSRQVGGQYINSYDDRYIVQTAAQFKGVIVSLDNFKDLYDEQVSWRDTIEKSLLPFTWIDDYTIYFPQDPLGRDGPKLDDFLLHCQ